MPAIAESLMTDLHSGLSAEVPPRIESLFAEFRGRRGLPPCQRGPTRERSERAGEFSTVSLAMRHESSVDVEDVIRRLPACKESTLPTEFKVRFSKAGRSAWLFKIPPLACGQSAPFNKGVNTCSPARLAATASVLLQMPSPEIGEEPIETGHPPTRILECARHWRSGLIVPGRQASVGLEALLLRSVSKNVIQAADCDVLVVSED